MELYVVKYSGPFGFIKPWTAVRDSETFSQQFLTPSIIEGMEKKIFPELLDEPYGKATKILRHRLNYQGLDSQQERTWSKGGINVYKDKNQYKSNMAIITRGIMINPNLYLGFGKKEDALRAFSQTICLCRNEDLLHPESFTVMTENEFDDIGGFELVFSNSEKGFIVGHNRFKDGEEMFGELNVIGNPIRN